MNTILLTGGTGSNGKPSLEQFANTELPVRALLRDPAKGTLLLGMSVMKRGIQTILPAVVA